MAIKIPKVVERKFKDNGGLTYLAFEKIPRELMITPDTESGVRVHVAKAPQSAKFYFRKFHDVGAPGFPLGGFTILDEKYDTMYSCYYESAILHPSNLKKRRKKNKKTLDLSSFFE